MTLPIDLLTTFIAVAESGSFTKAAESIHRTQSAVSMQMKRLEELSGQPLFDKKGRSVTMTPAGETLLGYARRMMSIHDEALSAMTTPDLSGRVRFGCDEDYASMFLPSVLAGFRRIYPRIRVDIQSSPNTMLQESMRRGELDLCLLDNCPEGGRVVHREPVIWAGSRLGTAHKENPLPLAVYHEGCKYRQWALEALHEIGKEYWISFVSPSITSILAAVKMGLAVAPIGASIVNESLRVLGPETGLPILPVSEVRLYQSQTAKNEPVTCFADYVTQSFQFMKYSGKEVDNEELKKGVFSP